MSASVTATVGKTPLVKLEKLSSDLGLNIYAKFEAANPGSSIKDRPALQMIEAAEAAGIISPEKTTLVEPTSGNTGVAIAMIGAAKGYKVILAMPESMSKERRALMAAFGAKLHLTPAAEGMRGAVAEADRIAAEDPNAWIVGQFVNPENPRAHELYTAEEIRSQLGGVPDILVAGVGTGGTVSGNARSFHATNPDMLAYAVEPAESPIIGQALRGEDITPNKHGIQGIGANFIPANLDLSQLAGAVQVSTQEALETARNIAVSEGFLVGISSGANIAAVKKLVADHPEWAGKTLVTFLVDTGERYLSTPLFEGIA